MANGFQGTISSLATCPFGVLSAKPQYQYYEEVYKVNCHRIYSLAFWVTGNELVAEQLSADTLLRAFASVQHPNRDQVDRAFMAEARKYTPLGFLTLHCAVSPDTVSIRGNVNRLNLERAVLMLPATERLVFLLHDVEGYEHGKISSLLGITESESRLGLHQARMQIRSLLKQPF